MRRRLTVICFVLLWVFVGAIIGWEIRGYTKDIETRELILRIEDRCAALEKALADLTIPVDLRKETGGGRPPVDKSR